MATGCCFFPIPRETAAQLAKFSRNDSEKYLRIHASPRALRRDSAPSPNHHSAGHRQSLHRRTLEAAENRSQRPRPRQKRHDAPAALGPHGRSRSSLRIFRDGTAARRDRRARNLRRSDGAVVRRQHRAASCCARPPIRIRPARPRFRAAEWALSRKPWPQAATKAGAEIRTSAPVERILVKDGAAAGVVLEGGEEISAKTVISNADPRRTFLKLTDPVHLPPGFVVKMQNFRANGTVAKINLALDRLPNFTALQDVSTAAALSMNDPAPRSAAESTSARASII